MNPGRLDKLAILLTKQPVRTDIGSVRDDWVELEKLWVGRETSGGKALDLTSREANEIEVVYLSHARPAIKPGLRLTAEGVTYDIVRVDPGRQASEVLIYGKVAV